MFMIAIILVISFHLFKFFVSDWSNEFIFSNFWNILIAFINGYIRFLIKVPRLFFVLKGLSVIICSFVNFRILAFRSRLFRSRNERWRNIILIIFTACLLWSWLKWFYILFLCLFLLCLIWYNSANILLILNLSFFLVLYLCFKFRFLNHFLQLLILQLITILRQLFIITSKTIVFRELNIRKVRYEDIYYLSKLRYLLV